MLMPTAIPRARRGSSDSSTKRFGALLLALGVSRFLRPRQPNSRQGLAEKRRVRPSETEPVKGQNGGAPARKKDEEKDRGAAGPKPRGIPAKGWEGTLFG